MDRVRRGATYPVGAGVTLAALEDDLHRVLGWMNAEARRIVAAFAPDGSAELRPTHFPKFCEFCPL